MATLIPYPQPDYNSYVDLAEANDIADEYLQGTQWSALSVLEQTRYLLQAFRTIQNIEGFTDNLAGVPELFACLKRSQVEIALHDLQYGISLGEFNAQEVKLEKAGPVEMEYFQTPKGVKEVDLIPSTAYKCLEAFGATFEVSMDGIYTINKTRY